MIQDLPRASDYTHSRAVKQVECKKQSVKGYGHCDDQMDRRGPCSPAMAAGLTDHLWTIKEGHKIHVCKLE
jgi:hypothetical protein